MIDTEIIKGFGEWANSAPRGHEFKTCVASVLDLVKRQKDEIEGLIVAQETLQKYVAKLNKELERANAKATETVRCKACKYNVANMTIDENDATDYSGEDIVCSYFMTDGLHPDDYCSRGERSESE